MTQNIKPGINKFVFYCSLGSGVIGAVVEYPEGNKLDRRSNMFAKGRHPALDVARGLAVLCMMYEHFVPMDTDNVPWQVAAARVAEIA